MVSGVRYAGPREAVAPGLASRASTSDKLWRWYRNYSRRSAGNVNVVVIGDSIAWGAGLPVGSTPDLSDPFNSMCNQLQRMLNGDSINPGRHIWELGPISGANNYPPGGGYFVRTAFRNAGSGLPVPWRETGTFTSIQRGVGTQSTQINAASFLSLTCPSATAFQWIYEDGASNTGTHNARIYPGEYNTAPECYQTPGFVLTPNTGLPQYTRSMNTAVMPARGKWTIEFRVTSGTPILDGVYVCDNDLNQGVRVWNWAWTGSFSSDFMGSNTKANTAADSIAVVPGGVDCLVIYLGANDFANQLSVSTFQSNLTAIITKYRAEQTRPMPVLIVGHFKRYDQAGATFAWPLYEAAMLAVAKATADCDYLALKSWFPTTQVLDTDGDLVDGSGVHLTAAGQGIAAQAMARRLSMPEV